MIFCYHIIDSTDALRIGYIESTSAEQAKEVISPWATSVLSITEVDEKPTPIGRLVFKGKKDTKDFFGTIEASDKRAALTLLYAEYHPEIFYIMSKEDQGTDIGVVTMATQDILRQLLDPTPLAEEEKKEAPKYDGFIQSYAWQKIDLFLGEVDIVLASLHGDKQFDEDIKTIQIQHHNLSNTNIGLDDGYSALSLILRELAFIASSMDPTPLQDDIRSLENKTAKLLQLFEKAKVSSRVQRAPLSDHRRHIQGLRKKVTQLRTHSTSLQTVEFTTSTVLLKEVPFILRIISLSLLGIFMLLLLYTTSTNSQIYDGTIGILARVILPFSGSYIGLYIIRHNSQHPFIKMLGAVLIALSISTLVIIS